LGSIGLAGYDYGTFIVFWNIFIFGFCYYTLLLLLFVNKLFCKLAAFCSFLLLLLILLLKILMLVLGLIVPNGFDSENKLAPWEIGYGGGTGGIYLYIFLVKIDYVPGLLNKLG